MRNIGKDALASAMEDLPAFCMAHGVDVNFFKQVVFEEIQQENDEADIRQWLLDYLGVDDATDKDVAIILARYTGHYDSDYGVWDNISGAYDAVKEQLSFDADRTENER